MSDAPTLVEDCLRATYRAVTTRTDYQVVPALVPDTTLTPMLPRQRRPVVALVGIAIVVALVVGVFALVQRDDASTPRPVAPPSHPRPIFPPVRTHVGPELYLQPSEVPAGFSLVQGTSDSGGGAGSADASQVWAKLDAVGRVRAVLVLSWRPVVVPHNSPGAPPRVSVSIPNGAPVAINGHLGGLKHGTVSWVQAGQLVSLGRGSAGRLGSWPERLSRREVVSQARRVERQSDGTYMLPEPPTGYRLAAEAPDTRSTGNHVRQLVYSDGNGKEFSVQLTDDTTSPPGSAVTWPLGVRVVRVRGTYAVSTPFLNGGDGSGCGPRVVLLCKANSIDIGQPDIYRYLQWLEPDGTRVTISTAGLDDGARFQIASDLREVSQADWDQLVASAPSR